MQRESVYELVHRIPVDDHPKTMLVLRDGFAITVEIFFRFEPTYMVVRGREAGTNDDSRAFFVPYDEVVYLKVDRAVNVNELRKMYGEPPLAEFEDKLAEGHDGAARAAEKPAPAPEPLDHMDPAEIARQNLLARIRAARTFAGSSRATRR